MFAWMLLLSKNGIFLSVHILEIFMLTSLALLFKLSKRGIMEEILILLFSFLMEVAKSMIDLAILLDVLSVGRSLVLHVKLCD